MSCDVVGREPELAELAGAVRAAATGAPAVALIAGDAGIGKSTLVAEAVRRAEVPAFVGRCVQVGGDAIALAPLVDLVRQVQRRDDGTGDDLAAALRSGRGRDVFGLTLDLLGALAAEGPAVVAFEDLHWADPGTWDLVDYLVRNLSDEPVVLVGTYRADEVARQPGARRRIAELSRLPIVRRIDLGGLDRDAVAEQVAALLGTAPTPSLVDELLRRGEGNPFFTEELAAAHAAGESIPSLLTEFVAADLAAVSPDARRVVGVVAAVGRDAHHLLVEAVAGVDPASVEAGVRDALDARLLVIDRATDAYRVRHPLIGEVAYAALLPTERVRLHRSIADRLRANGDPLSADADAAGELAFHLDRAGEQRKAFDALLAAADAARNVAAATCLGHLDRALELWPDHGADRTTSERIERTWLAADLSSAVGDNRRAVDLADAALALGDPPHGHAWACERRGRYLWADGRITESVAAYREAATLAVGRDDPRAAPAFAGLGQAGLMFCNFAEAERWSRLALDTADADDRSTRSTAERIVGVVTTMRGDVEDGLARCRASVELADASHSRVLSIAYVGMLLLDVGRAEEAVRVALDGAAEARHAGFETSFAAFLDATMAMGLVRTGRWDEAAAVLRSVENVEAMPIAAVGLDGITAVLAARRGDAERAREWAVAAASLPTDPWHEPIAREAVVEIHLHDRNWDEAITIAQGVLTPSDGDRDVRWAARFVELLVTATVEGPSMRSRDARTSTRTASSADSASVSMRCEPRRSRAGRSPRCSSRSPTQRSPASAVAVSERVIRMRSRMQQSWPIASATCGRRRRCGSTRPMVRPPRGMPPARRDALHSAYASAARLGAVPLLERAQALSRRIRIAVDPAVPRAVPQHDVAGSDSHDSRGRGPRARRGRAHEPRDRHRALRLREDGERPRVEHPPQARRLDEGGGCRRRPAPGHLNRSRAQARPIRSVGGDGAEHIEPGGPAGGQDGGERPGEAGDEHDGEHTADRDGERRGGREVRHRPGQRPATHDADGHAGDGAEGGDHHRLPADHRPHLAAGGADRPEHPELAGPLEHGQADRVGDAEDSDDHGQGEQPGHQVEHRVDALGLRAAQPVPVVQPSLRLAGEHVAHRRLRGRGLGAGGEGDQGVGDAAVADVGVEGGGRQPADCRAGHLRRRRRGRPDRGRRYRRT